MGSLAPFTPMSSCTPAATKPFNTGEALNLTSFKLRESGGLEPQLDDSVFEDEVDDLIDMSVRILPGVRSLINSLPQDKYAIATSGAKTYCHGCLNRTGLVLLLFLIVISPSSVVELTKVYLGFQFPKSV